MCNWLKNRGYRWYKNVAVSDECWVSLGGHVFTRNQAVLWSKKQNGSSENWASYCSQGEKKVMVLTVLHGSGRIFGPYFKPEGAKYNSALYKQLLEDEVFPDMLNELGHERFFNMTWQQDGARPHIAKPVMELLSATFGSKLLSDKAPNYGGKEWAPYSPDLSPLDFFLWARIKNMVFCGQSLPDTMEELTHRIITAHNMIGRREVRRAIRCMKKRAKKCIKVNGGVFEGRKIRIE